VQQDTLAAQGVNSEVGDQQPVRTGAGGDRQPWKHRPPDSAVETCVQAPVAAGRRKGRSAVDEVDVEPPTDGPGGAGCR